MRRRVKVGKTFDLSVSVNDETFAENSERPGPRRDRHVAVGQEFKADIVVSENRVDDEVTRSQIVWVVFAAIAAFLFGAAALGLYQGEFSALQGVWSATAPAYGAIAGYFFSRREDGKGHRKK